MSDSLRVPEAQVIPWLGQAAQLSLQRSKAAILIVRPGTEGEQATVTILNPKVLDHVDERILAAELLDADWSESEIVAYLEARRHSRAHPSTGR